MGSRIVIKVKYAETLRRFNANVVDGELDLDLNGLREKILDLFNFTPDTKLTLTYVDEDNDTVTIGSDEDLLDVVKQGLNPLRITVKLNTEGSGKTYSRSSGSSTPLRSPRVQQPMPNFNYNVVEIFKNVPEPILKCITKICAEVASTGTTSGPSISEVVQCFAEAGFPYLKLLSEFQSGHAVSDTTSQVEPLGSPADPSTTPEGGDIGNTANQAPFHDADGSKVNEVSSNVLANERTERKSSKSNELIPIIKSEVTPITEEITSSRVTGGSKGSAAQIPGLESLKSSLDSVNVSGSMKKPILGALDPKVTTPSQMESVEKKEADKSNECIPDGNFVKSSTSDTPALNFTSGSKKVASVSGDDKGSSKHNVSAVPKSVNLNAFPFPSVPAKAKWCNWDSQPLDASSGVKNVFGSGLGNSSDPNLFPSPTDECPFTGMPAGDNTAIGPLYPSFLVPPSRYLGHRDGSGIIFHRGVRCDGCGVHPITGPRYKSKVKEDYDLCSICFSQMGIESDYIRMDRPVTYRHPFPFKGLHDDPDSVHRSSRPQVFRGCGVKPVRSKLDSRFIQDVNILDGTLMAPSVSFTKIWRMRNTGSVAWPKGTQLVWIGGSRLSDAFSVELEISATGLPVDQELDIAVDFTAPDHPGQYISYWRMALPSGQKFGQRVWVLIQVGSCPKESPNECSRGFNLNLPPVTNGASGPETINVNQESVADDALSLLCELAKSNSTTGLVEPIVDVAPKTEQELNFSISDSLLVSGGVSNTVPTVLSSSASYPIVDLPEVTSAPSPVAVGKTSAPSSSVSYPIVDLSEVASAPFRVAVGMTSAQDVGKLAEVEETLLRDPVSVGKTSAQDVGAHAEVEEILLKDLEEMGFKQVDLNKEILRLNEYDLGKSVDDLCGVYEWDPILEELHEMGFRDKEMNKKLLMKNDGSIKRVVMDLLAAEK